MFEAEIRPYQEFGKLTQSPTVFTIGMMVGSLVGAEVAGGCVGAVVDGDVVGGPVGDGVAPSRNALRCRTSAMHPTSPWVPPPQRMCWPQQPRAGFGDE